MDNKQSRPANQGTSSSAQNLSRLKAAASEKTEQEMVTLNAQQSPTAQQPTKKEPNKAKQPSNQSDNVDHLGMGFL